MVTSVNGPLLFYRRRLLNHGHHLPQIGSSRKRCRILIFQKLSYFFPQTLLHRLLHMQLTVFTVPSPPPRTPKNTATNPSLPPPPLQNNLAMFLMTLHHCSTTLQRLGGLAEMRSGGHTSRPELCPPSSCTQADRHAQTEAQPRTNQVTKTGAPCGCSSKVAAP
jgi:hypothetical protein